MAHRFTWAPANAPTITVTKQPPYHTHIQMTYKNGQRADVATTASREKQQASIGKAINTAIMLQNPATDIQRTGCASSECKIVTD